MLALCLMLSGTYYAKNYAGIIGRGLSIKTYWIVGVDYYPIKDVENIIHGVYPEATISSYLKDLGSYGSIDFDTLSGIWKASKLGDYKETPTKFDKDAFAACLKAEVAT